MAILASSVASVDMREDSRMRGAAAYPPEWDPQSIAAVVGVERWYSGSISSVK